MTIYRVTLRRESQQTVEFDTADFTDEENAEGPIQGAIELANPSSWYSDGDDVDAIQVSEDRGTTWRWLSGSEIHYLEKMEEKMDCKHPEVEVEKLN